MLGTYRVTSASSRPVSAFQRGRTQVFHAPKLDEARDPLPQIIPIFERLEARCRIQRQRPYEGVRPRLIEERNGIAWLARCDHPVLSRPDARTAPELEHLTEVEHERILVRGHIEPSTVPRTRLQSPDMILCEQRDEAGVRVRCPDHVTARSLRADPDSRITHACELRRSTHWIAQQTQRGKSVPEGVVEIMLRETETACDRAHEHLARLFHGM